jgi:hypothetical protein
MAQRAEEQREAPEYVGDILDVVDRRVQPLDYWERAKLIGRSAFVTWEPSRALCALVRIRKRSRPVDEPVSYGD